MKWGIKKINIRLCLSEAADPPSSEFFCDLQSRSTGPGSNNTSQEQLQLSRDLRGLFCLPCCWQIFNPSFHEHFWNICCGPNGRQIRNWEFRNAKQSLSPQGGYIFQRGRIQIASIAIYVWRRSVKKKMPGRTEGAKCCHQTQFGGKFSWGGSSEVGLWKLRCAGWEEETWSRWREEWLHRDCKKCRV